MNIRRLIEVQAYRRDPPPAQLPVRGQRTHTNARTRKGPAAAARLPARNRSGQEGLAETVFSCQFSVLSRKGFTTGNLKLSTWILELKTYYLELRQQNGVKRGKREEKTRQRTQQQPRETRSEQEEERVQEEAREAHRAGTHCARGRFLQQHADHDCGSGRARVVRVIGRSDRVQGLAARARRTRRSRLPCQRRARRATSTE